MKRAALLLFFLIYIATMTGCWDARELDALIIVAGVGIDTSNQQGEYDFTVESGKAQKSKSGGDGNGAQDMPYLILTSTSKTMLLALERSRFKSSRELFLHPNQVVIFGKDLACQGLKPLMDMFMRDHESRLEVWALVANGTANDMLATDTKQEPIPAAAIARLMENATAISKHYGTKMFDLISRLAAKGTSTIIPIISQVTERDSVSLALSGSAVFNGDKMIGELDADETQGYVFAMGDMEDGILQVSMQEGTAILQISALSSKAVPILKDGQITIELNVKSQLAMGELQGFKNMKMSELMPLIEKAAGKEIANKIVNTFSKTQSLKTDIYGYGISIYRKYPKEWDSMKDNWSSIYPGITLKLTVSTQLTNTGLIVDSLDMRGTK
jgi:spore germination protein KC